MQSIEVNSDTALFEIIIFYVVIFFIILLPWNLELRLNASLSNIVLFEIQGNY